MTFAWLKPTKYRLVLFIIISLLLFYLPFVPTLSAPVVLDPVYQWGLKSPAYSMKSAGLTGVSDQYFGIFAGTDAALLNLIYMLKRPRSNPSPHIKNYPRCRVRKLINAKSF